MSQNSSRRITWILFDAFDILAFLVFVIGIIMFIRFFIFNPYNVVGQSMAPTVNDSDFLLISKFTDKENLTRGDIIIFVPQGQDPFIKRIIGLPGETVQIENGNVNICDNTSGECAILQEDYINNTASTIVNCDSVYNGSYPVTEGFFVLGDNRRNSTDSRCCFTHGCFENGTYEVTNDMIIGKLSYRLYPFDSITGF